MKIAARYTVSSSRRLWTTAIAPHENRISLPRCRVRFYSKRGIIASKTIVVSLEPDPPLSKRCAERILRRGQEKGEVRSVDYGRALRRTHDAKASGPSGCVRAGARVVAALDR